MPKIKFKRVKINWGNFLNYLLLIILSSFLFLNILIALPLTERLSNVTALDLNVVDEFWSKEYILDLESDSTDDLGKSKNILFRRLNLYGVEEVSIHEKDGNLEVVVNTSLPQIYVEELIKNPYQYSIVTRKEDVDFENEEDPYAQYMIENYNDTEFDASTFRNIYVTMLPDSNGTDSYFGIAKLWPHKTKVFKQFLDSHIDEYIGINIDGFVTPMYISDSSIFAIPLGSSQESIKAIDILYNSGNMPTSYTLSQQNDLESRVITIDYIEVTIALFVVIVAIYTYLFFTKMYSKILLTSSLFATLLAIASLLSLLKITYLPVIPFVLVIEAVFVIILTRAIITNPESKYLITGSVFVTGLIFKLLGIGYLKIIGNDLLTLSLLVLLSVIFSNYYIINISKYFKT